MYLYFLRQDIHLSDFPEKHPKNQPKPAQPKIFATTGNTPPPPVTTLVCMSVCQCVIRTGVKYYFQSYMDRSK